MTQVLFLTLTWWLTIIQNSNSRDLTQASHLQGQHTHIRRTRTHSGKTLIYIKLSTFSKREHNSDICPPQKKRLPGIRNLGPTGRMGNEGEEMKIR